jgi:hypothetical protein
MRPTKGREQRINKIASLELERNLISRGASCHPPTRSRSAVFAGSISTQRRSSSTAWSGLPISASANSALHVLTGVRVCTRANTVEIW